MRRPLSIAPRKAGALFIDLQEEHRHDSRYLVEDFAGILANVQRLQACARATAIPLLHAAYIVEQPNRPFHPTMADGTSAFSDASSPHAALCAEIAPKDGEHLMIKTDASVFANGSLAPLLKQRGIEWLYVAGVWSEACVFASVKDAVEQGFHVLLVKDACGSGTQTMHETAVLNMANRLYGGAVADTDGACRLMRGETIEAWQVQGSVPIRYTYENAAQLYRDL
jgi:maleamate amidohydrolase